mmetsp:Transcript_69767/g.130300  ORF Transcript_69767/g.130300 Transcript_69767/m.130300 type:complete len:444 (-) Transcript_69767:24-1355(-)
MCAFCQKALRRVAARSYASSGLHTIGLSALTRQVGRGDSRGVVVAIRPFSDGHGHSHGHSHGHGHGHSASHGASGLLGHAHDHSESHALELAQLKGEALRITSFGFGFNCVLGAIQVYVGLACNSAGLLSDGTHTLADSGSDIVTLLALRVMQSASKAVWPYGPGKIDSIAAMGVGGVLLTSGGTAMLHSLQMLLEVPGVPEIPVLSSLLDGGEHGHQEHGHSHSNSEHGASHASHGHVHGGAVREDGFAGQLALGTCVLTMAGKELLYRMTASIAERTGSSLLLANALHHRSDAMCSFVVLAGLLGRMFLHAAFDPLAGSIVAGYIIKMSFGIGSRALRELLDRQLPSSTREDLTVCLNEVIAGWPSDNAWHIRGLHLKGVSGRRAGPETHLLVELGLANASWGEATAEEVAQLEKLLLRELLQKGQMGIMDVRVVIKGDTT